MGALQVPPDSFELVYWGTWVLIVEWRNLATGKKTSLVVGGTRTQVLAGRMAIATSVAPSRPSYVMS